MLNVTEYNWHIHMNISVKHPIIACLRILLIWFLFASISGCPVCYVAPEEAIASMPSSPSVSPVLRNLTYVHDENPNKTEPHGGSDFGGFPSLEDRNAAFDIKETMTVHCGLVQFFFRFI